MGWYRIWSPDSPYTKGTPAEGGKYYEAWMSGDAAGDLVMMLRLITGDKWYSNEMGYMRDSDYIPRSGYDKNKGKDGKWMAAENWGGDPDGKLAKALAKAREKSKKPRKPLKIERLDTESFNALDMDLDRSDCCELWVEKLYDEGRIGFGEASTLLVSIEDGIKCSSLGSPTCSKHDSSAEYLLLDRLHPSEPSEKISEDEFDYFFTEDENGFGNFFDTLEEAKSSKPHKKNNLHTPFHVYGRHDGEDWQLIEGDRWILDERWWNNPYRAENRPPSYMADSDAHKLMEASWRINSFVESGEEYPEWWKSRLSVAASNVDDLADYLDYAMSDDYDAETFHAHGYYQVYLYYGGEYPNEIRYARTFAEAQSIENTSGAEFSEIVNPQGNVVDSQTGEEYPPLVFDAEFNAKERSIAKKSWDTLNNVETAVGTIGLAHMIGLGALFGGGLAFLKGRKSNSKTEK